MSDGPEVTKLKKRLFDFGVQNFHASLGENPGTPEDIARQANAALDELGREAAAEELAVTQAEKEIALTIVESLPLAAVVALEVHHYDKVAKAILSTGIVKEMVEALRLVRRGIESGHIEDQTLIRGSKSVALSDELDAVLAKLEAK